MMQTAGVRVDHGAANDRDIVETTRGHKESKEAVARNVRKISDLLGEPVCAVVVRGFIPATAVR
jgi:hypothetical protein